MCWGIRCGTGRFLTVDDTSELPVGSPWHGLEFDTRYRQRIPGTGDEQARDAPDGLTTNAESHAVQGYGPTDVGVSGAVGGAWGSVDAAPVEPSTGGHGEPVRHCAAGDHARPRGSDRRFEWGSLGFEREVEQRGHATPTGPNQPRKRASRDHRLATPGKNYRYSTNLQVAIDAHTRLVVALGDPQPGNRNDTIVYRTSGIDQRLAGRPTAPTAATPR